MKKITIILRAFLLLCFLAPSIEAVAVTTKVLIRHITVNKGKPRPRTEPLICMADKEAGYVELHFMEDLGDVEVRIIDSNGNIVDQTTTNTASGLFVTMNLSDSDGSYEVEIEGNEYCGYGAF